VHGWVLLTTEKSGASSASIGVRENVTKVHELRALVAETLSNELRVARKIRNTVRERERERERKRERER
jgi:hypothetical protein